jgi:hypothetical protein
MCASATRPFGRGLLDVQRCNNDADRFRSGWARHGHDRKPTAPETKGARPSAPSAPSSPPEKVNRANGFAARGMRTVGDLADGPNSGIGSTVRADAVKTKEETNADGADGNFPPQTAPKSVGWSARL